MNKNLVIGVLAALLVLASLWGQVGNKTKKSVVREKKVVEAQLLQVETEAAATHDALLVKTAQLQKSLQFTKSQMKKSRNELVGLRKDNQTLEAKLAERKMNFELLVQKKDAQIKQLKQKKGSQPKIAKQPARTAKRLARTAKQVAELQDKIIAMEKQFSTALNDAVMKEKQNSKELNAKLKSAATVIQDLQEKLQEKTAAADSTAAAVADIRTNNESEQNRIKLELESMNAQILGLEKIVDEKNIALEETSRELDHWKVNMDVLLSRITEQKDGLQELQEENIGLVKELTAKNKELADLSEQIIKTPVQQ